ncbi:prolyl oligopeptidase family serine peptidase [Niabella hibiscisoli]|uniref:prolyl oligopeptidase family serine peptidase n=1 Tax=Niabella hibiscisoli TaxID=1825928 RepID=UPI001F0EBD68|nr:prolyl oligopeptidase family serine peptidase [Niabella hibiscisoli]MCH5717721.1 prolyl oligopeptidase family serine peptidase [Niabella hibiscisoli]
MLNKLTFILLVALMPSQLWAQQTAEKLVQETNYLLYLPENYKDDTARKWPLVIFLHGSGESGDDLNKVKFHGPPKLVEAGRQFPFILVSPQAPPNTGWQLDVLKALLNDLKKKYKVDEDRVYMTGLSMGGFGTWNYAEKYPSDLAAIAPVCGGGDAEKAWTLRYMPIWCFHGAKDDVVLPAASISMIDAVRKLNKKAEVKFTLYPDANHNSWDITYNNDSLYQWLLSKKRFRFNQVAVPDAALKSYVGKYADSKKDTVTLMIEEGRLLVKDVNNKIFLKASSPVNFYWQDDSIDEIEFSRNEKGAITGFSLLMGDRKFFRRVEK